MLNASDFFLNTPGICLGVLLRDLEKQVGENPDLIWFYDSLQLVVDRNAKAILKERNPGFCGCNVN